MAEKLPKHPPFTDEDFAEMPLLDFDRGNPEQVALWNRFVPFSPKELYTSICTGKLAGCHLKTGFSSGGGMDLQLSRADPSGRQEIFDGRDDELFFNIPLILADGCGDFSMAKVAPRLQGDGIGTLAVTRMIRLAQRLGVSRIRGEMTLGAGGYAWPRLGFMPWPHHWDDLREEYLKPRLAALAPCIPENARAQLEAAVTDDNPESIFLIAAIKTPARDVPLGRWLLASAYWNIDDPEIPHLEYECWKDIKATALARLETLAPQLPSGKAEKLTILIRDTPWKDVPELLGIPETVSSIPVGKLMLVGTRWYGELDFANPTQAAVFDAIAERDAPAPAPVRAKLKLRF